MATDPAPLANGTVLGDRFTVHRVLGRGGFGIAYLARDEARGDMAVVKELAPVGVKRSAEGNLDLDTSGTSGHLLRHRFLQEAQTLRRLHHAGIPGLRAAFAENGTAYHVTTYIPRGRTLEERLRRDGPLDEPTAREVFASLLDVLEVVHAAGVLHRDVKPSNVLLGPEGEVVLLDFGAARDWAAGGAITHTVMHTPGYAPPEQLSERAARGAATDLYALCATTYHALIGKAPPTAPDRIAGIPLVPLLHLRPELDPGFAAAIEAGLELKMTDRPESVMAMRQRLLTVPSSNLEHTLQIIDETLLRLRSFRFDKRACPACDGALIEPRPLRRHACPVCREGTVRIRDLDPGLCPACRSGRLLDVDNTHPLAICPCCGHGVLHFRRKGLLGTARAADCGKCHAQFELDGDRLTSGEDSATCDEWRLRSGRSRHLRRCPDCDAQFDEVADGRWRRIGGAGNGTPALHWEDWVRIAAGLEPGVGNAACDTCRADYWREGERLTLLDAARDPYGFVKRYVGRPLGVEDVRWIGAGKASGEAGFSCEDCATEFDRDGPLLRLAGSPSRRLSRHIDESKRLEDWHRIAQDLPTCGEEEEFEARLAPLLLDAYLNGEIAFDGEGALWRGKATRREDEAGGTLVITPSELSFGGRLRRWRVSMEDVLEVSVENDVLTLNLRAESEPVEFDVLPMTLTAHLKSGDRSLDLSAGDLAERLVRVAGGE